MKNRPWVVKWITASLLLVPLVCLGIAFFSIKVRGVHLTTKVIIDLWVVTVASGMAALGVWRVRPWGFFLFFAFILGVIGEDLFHIVHNPKTFNLFDLVDVSFVALGIIFILQKHVSAPYFNPKIRWWERPQRHKVDLRAYLMVGESHIPSQVLDISHSGCFIDTEASLNTGDVVAFDLVFKEFKFESSARVMRKSNNPKGVGLMFFGASRQNQREIKRIIKDLRKNLNNAPAPVAV